MTQPFLILHYPLELCQEQRTVLKYYILLSHIFQDLSSIAARGKVIVLTAT